MNHLSKKFLASLAVLGLLLAGCGAETAKTTKSKESTSQNSQSLEKQNQTEGVELTKLLGSTNWQGTKVYDDENNDVTEENANFIGLAKYDAETGHYEFFDAKTGDSREDAGTFFLTNDGTKRILLSETMNYQAVVEVTELTNEQFTYKRKGKDHSGNEVDVFVEHIPYNERELSFTNSSTERIKPTGTIDTNEQGTAILAKTLWNGTRVVDEAGKDVTEANRNFISLAKYDDATNKYEFFQLDTGESRGDFGYFSVLDHNQIRAHVSLGENKYGVALPLTELTPEKFTYTRMGKNNEGQDIRVFVEHEPYQGKLIPTFTF